jgi:hypothetical protein
MYRRGCATMAALRSSAAGVAARAHTAGEWIVPVRASEKPPESLDEGRESGQSKVSRMARA